jgi:glycosyltransferase involved in cell wall biosynthesis
MKILVLSTWFPYPPIQGSKTRAYQLIKALANSHDVALISFEDVPVQPEWRDHLAQLCRIVESVPQNPFSRNLARQWLGRLSLTPSSVLAGYSEQMSGCVRAVAAEWCPDAVLALTFVTAPYALQVKGVRRIVDVDNLLAPMLSDSYHQAELFLPRLRRYLAYWKFRRYERWLFRQFDLCLLVSARDIGVVQHYIPLKSCQIGLAPNGVDLEYYRPCGMASSNNSLVYSGALTYGPNYDAVNFFLQEIFPFVRREIPEARLSVTGSTQRDLLEQLSVKTNVTFTGHVEDIRPVIASSSVCVVPLRQGAGTRLKILEAMALGTPVISTSKGAEGLDVEPGRHLLIADRPEDFAAQTVRLLRDRQLREKLALAANQLVRERYDWANIGGQLRDLFDNLPLLTADSEHVDRSKTRSRCVA